LTRSEDETGCIRARSRRVMSAMLRMKKIEIVEPGALPGAPERIVE
jgi:hypothetical protein